MEIIKDYLYNFTSGIGLSDVIDIILVAFLVYEILLFIKKTRAEQLVKGIVILVVIMFVSGALHLYTLNWILKETMTLGILALVILFQPELRRGLEFIGHGKMIKALGHVDKDGRKQMISEFISAIDSFSKTKTGALIIIERDTMLDDIIETGTIIDATLSDQILGNIFYEGAPLHDGAVIIRAGRVYAAGCVLPLTQNRSLSKDLGTRHRAGIGITENSDALVLIVSEETGIISIAEDGKLTRFLDIKDVEKKLLSIFIEEKEEGLSALKSRLLGRDKNV